MDVNLRIDQQVLTLGNGVVGRPIVIASANPRHYEDIVSGAPGRSESPPVALHAALFVPDRMGADSGSGKHPVVIIVPGSGGVNPAMMVHARALTDVGIAALVLDPFGGRTVVDTIAAQQQFSFAASTYDVFAAMRRLQSEPDIDGACIAAMGYSRGGLAVLQAAMRMLSEPSLGVVAPLRAVLAAWPWCGHQFDEPDVGNTAIRILAADKDNWASMVQAQACYHSLRLRHHDVSMTVARDALHGFGYGVPAKQFPQAMVALNAPILYFARDGVMFDPWTGERRPDMDDLQIMTMLAPFISRGVTVGSRDGQMQWFMDEATAFFVQRLSTPGSMSDSQTAAVASTLV